MENTLSHFQVSGLEIKLTEDKLFINTSISNEAFALRSVDGIGIVDLVEHYNNCLWANQQQLKSSIIPILGGITFSLMGLFIGNLISPIFGTIVFIIGVLVLALGINMRKGIVEPTLKSSVRIMMSGGNRDFMFDKADTNSNSVAEFVAKVENTLTAFHKKNS